MSKRAEEAALTAYPDSGVDAYSRGRKKTYRQKYIEGYEQAEKETIERAVKWLEEALQFGIHICNGHNTVEQFKKAMEE